VVSGLALRRGVVVSADPLEVEVDGVPRRAWADETLLGPMREGDEVVVNTAALNLGLGSGGFDVVHVNLTRGLGDGASGADHVMKLNYTSLQQPVAPVEALAPRASRAPASELKGPHRALTSDAEAGAPGEARGLGPVGVLPLHGHLAPAAWALGQARPAIRVGYVQTVGGALPGAMSRDVAELRDRGLLAGHITAGPAYGGEHEAISTVGALDAAVGALGWEAILVGPGPGIIGSDTEFGHGGIAALDSVHAALSLQLPTVLSPRLSSADPRKRHRGLSHHTRTVLELLLAPVTVAFPEGFEEIGTELEQAVSDSHHTLQIEPVDLDAYEASGLPISTMGRSLQEDPAFFAAALASGALLASPSAGGANTGTPRT
jgi:hypothetical protein